VRRIGYAPATRRVTVADGADVTANFELTKTATTLNTVVTTATGDQRKVEIGNTVATLSADSLSSVAPITSITDMLQGRVSGMLTFSNSGVTGSAPRIRIRGFNSLSQSNQPLMIIDGVRVDPAQDRPFVEFRRGDEGTGKYGFAVACQPSCTAVTGKDGPLFFTYYKYGGFPPIVAVRPGSPAERAGVKVGDRVTKIDGRSILDEDGALRLASVDQRETLRLTVQRDGKDVEYVLKFAR